MLTEEEIVRMAQKAGLGPLTISALEFRDGSLSRFAALVTEAEREACLAEIETGIWLDKTTEEVLAEIATAIRDRNNKDNQQ